MPHNKKYLPCNHNFSELDSTTETVADVWTFSGNGVTQKSQKTCNNLNSTNAVKRKIENIKYI